MGGGGGEDRILPPWETPVTGPTGGVKPMSITGRVGKERERMAGMTPEEREWRRKWVEDQRIQKEPRQIPVMRNMMLNPIRRMYRWPLDFIFYKGVAPFMGFQNADTLRFYTGKVIMGVLIGCSIAYYFKYNTNEWTTHSGWRVIKSHKAVYPGEPGFPALHPVKEPHEYYDRGFGHSVLARRFPQYKHLHGDEECEQK